MRLRSLSDECFRAGGFALVDLMRMQGEDCFLERIAQCRAPPEVWHLHTGSHCGAGRVQI